MHSGTLLLHHHGILCPRPAVWGVESREESDPPDAGRLVFRNCQWHELPAFAQDHPQRSQISKVSNVFSCTWTRVQDFDIWKHFKSPHPLNKVYKSALSAVLYGRFSGFVTVMLQLIFTAEQQFSTIVHDFFAYSNKQRFIFPTNILILTERSFSELIRSPQYYI